jgi:two-component system sensor histidine kinase MprB
MARTLTRPLDQLRTAAGRIATSGELSEPIPITRNDEVGQLTESFNTMASALLRSRRAQRQLVLDAGHELRTPLTSLRANVELLQRASDLPVDARAEILDDVNFELTELSEMVGELVDLATDADRSDEPFAAVRLDELVSGVVERARRRTGRVIELSATPVVVDGRETQLERAISNLLVNAHKFSPPDEPIEVSVAGPVVTVRDHGPGVSADERDHIFDRFYRTASGRSAPGSGLGLAIVAQVVGAHGGRVWVDDAPGGGARFHVELASPSP